MTELHIIPRSGDWKNALADAIRDPAELLGLLQLPASLLHSARSASGDFALRVPRSYAARMRPGDANDPLLRQVLPLAEEFHSPESFLSDPVGDLNAATRPGVLHKYHGRVLLITTGACAVHCRFCFRRHFPYHNENPAGGQWQQALEYIAADNSISEVILSGGDPLLLDDERLEALLTRLASIDHLQHVRVHTRLPVVLPERITDNLIKLLTGGRLQPVMVIHSNHPAELQDDTATALKRLEHAGIRMFNQTVLLRDINDSADVLVTLSRRLFELGTLPYYLHQLDRVRGAAHFEVSDNHASQLLDQLRRRLPGYLVPRLVREIEGMPYKKPFDC